MWWRLVSILSLCSCFAVAASAQVLDPRLPDPELSDVPDAITLSPGAQFENNPIGTFVVHVEDQVGPIEGAIVEVEISADLDMLISWCGNPYNQIHPLQTAVSDANGDARFTFFGGGLCIDPSDWWPPTFIAQVRANNIVIKEPSITSPDAVNSQGRVAVDIEKSTCEAGTAIVSLADAVFHTRSLKLGLAEWCTNFTQPFNDRVGIVDAVFLTPYITKSGFCVCQ